MYDLKFDLSEKVIILNLETKGLVLEISITHAGIRYRVRYWKHGLLKEDYFYENELQKEALSGSDFSE